MPVRLVIAGRAFEGHTRLKDMQSRSVTGSLDDLLLLIVLLVLLVLLIVILETVILLLHIITSPHLVLGVVFRLLAILCRKGPQI